MFSVCPCWSSSSWTTCGKMVNLIKWLQFFVQNHTLNVVPESSFKKLHTSIPIKQYSMTCFCVFFNFVGSRFSCSPQMCWITACQLSNQSGLLHPANLVFTRENVNIDNICPLFCACTQVPPCIAIKQFDLRQKMPCKGPAEQQRKNPEFLSSILIAWMNEESLRYIREVSLWLPRLAPFIPPLNNPINSPSLAQTL